MAGRRSLQEFLTALRPEQISPTTFSSRVPDNWWDHERTFGGFTIAQSMAVAIASSDPAYRLHSLHGLFLSPIPVGSALDYELEPLRDGRSFLSRRVTCRLGERRVFEALLSFHRDEDGEEYQIPSAVHELAPPEAVESELDDWPIEIKELGPSPQRSDGTYASTRRAWLRLVGEPPLTEADKLIALGYISDMTRAAFRPHSLEHWGEHSDASMDHALWIHRKLDLSAWHLLDLEAVVNHGGRATLRGTISSRDGQIVASLGQELLIRRI